MLQKFLSLKRQTGTYGTVSHNKYRLNLNSFLNWYTIDTRFIPYLFSLNNVLNTMCIFPKQITLIFSNPHMFPGKQNNQEKPYILGLNYSLIKLKPKIFGIYEELFPIYLRRRT